MEFQVINRNRNAVIPEGMFKLCGMEDAKLISMVQLNGGILLMPESVSTYQLLMLIDALNEQACEFLEAVAAECGPAEAEHRDMTLDEVARWVFSALVSELLRDVVGRTDGGGDRQLVLRTRVVAEQRRANRLQQRASRGAA